MGLIEEILVGLALGVVVLVHAALAVSIVLVAREDGDLIHQFFLTIIAIILMIDPVVYIIALAR